MIAPTNNTDAVESEIRAAFAEHGTIQKVQMPLDRETVSEYTYLIRSTIHVYYFLLTFRNICAFLESMELIHD